MLSDLISATCISSAVIKVAILAIPTNNSTPMIIKATTVPNTEARKCLKKFIIHQFHCIPMN